MDWERSLKAVTLPSKPWPACAGTHPYIQATLQIADAHHIKPEDIEEIKFVLHSPNTMLCEPLESKRKPTAAIGAKFSIPFCIATALVHNKVTLDQFTPKALLDPDVLQVARKISYEMAASPIRNYAAPPGLVRVKTKHNEISSQGVEFLFGHPRNPMSQTAIIEKFTNCAAYSAKKIPRKSLDQMVHLILHLEDVKDISEVIDCLNR